MLESLWEKILWGQDINNANPVRIFAVTCAVIALSLLLTTCSAGLEGQASVSLSGSASASTTVDTALAELDALDAPEDVDEALFAELKDELAKQLAAKGASKAASTPPTSEVNKVNDLAVLIDGGAISLTWHYRNLGDYDQNGTVGISDITPIAMHYGESYEPTDVNCIAAVVDGSGSHTVDIGDITPLAMNFGVDCAGYRIEGDNSPTGTFTLVQQVDVDSGSGTGRKEFLVPLTEIAFAYYRVRPYDGDGSRGIASDAVPVAGEPPEIVSVSPTEGLEGQSVQFSAEVESVVSVTYAWDFGGGAAPNSSASSQPVVTLGAAGDYEASLAVTNAFGNDMHNFTLMVNPAPPVIDGVEPTEGYETQQVQFAATVTGSEPLTYAWDFGGGATPNTSSETSPLVTLNGAGVYNASLTVTNAADVDDYEFTLTVNPAGGEVLFEEPFEDTYFTSRGWYDNTGLQLSTEEHVPGSTRSVEFHFPLGATKPTSGGAMRMIFAETESIYVSYYVKYSANWEGSNKPYHPHEFQILTNVDHIWIGPAYTHLTAYIEQNEGEPLLAIQDAMNIDESRIGEDLTDVTELRAVAGCNGDSDGYGPGDCYWSGDVHRNGKGWRAGSIYFLDSMGPYYKNDWHFVEAYFELNSISEGKGVADGLLRYWYDGELIINCPGVMFRTGQHPDMAFNQFLIAPWIGDGSPVDQTFWVDNMTAATGRLAGD